MALVDFHTGKKPVTGWEAGVREVNLLHNNYDVLHMAVHGVNPEVGDDFYPSPTVLDWAHQRPHHIWEI